MQTKNTPAKPATKRQLEVLTMIHNHIKKYSYPPTNVEVAEHFKFNQNAAVCHIYALVDKAYLEKDRDKSRALKVTAKGKKAIREL